MKSFKHCVDCGTYYPKFMFKTDIRKFQLKIALGKVRVCRVCTWKKSGKGPVVRWDGSAFKMVSLSTKERVKEFISK